MFSICPSSFDSVTVCMYHVHYSSADLALDGATMSQHTRIDAGIRVRALPDGTTHIGHNVVGVVLIFDYSQRSNRLHHACRGRECQLQFYTQFFQNQHRHTQNKYMHPYRIYRRSFRHNMVTFLIAYLLATTVTLCKGWQSGSKLIPAPYEKAQTSWEMIYMQAVRSSRQLNTEVLHAHECVVSA